MFCYLIEAFWSIFLFPSLWQLLSDLVDWSLDWSRNPPVRDGRCGPGLRPLCLRIHVLHRGAGPKRAPRRHDQQCPDCLPVVSRRQLFSRQATAGFPARSSQSMDAELLVHRSGARVAVRRGRCAVELGGAVRSNVPWYPPKKKILSRLTGPPSVPPNWLRRRES